jgi:hypothetical protein
MDWLSVKFGFFSNERMHMRRINIKTFNAINYTLGSTYPRKKILVQRLFSLMSFDSTNDAHERMAACLSVDGFVLMHGIQEVEIASQKKIPYKFLTKKNFLETKS